MYQYGITESVRDSTAVHVSASVDELADADRALFTSIDSKDNIRARLRAANKRVSRRLGQKHAELDADSAIAATAA